LLLQALRLQIIYWRWLCKAVIDLAAG